MRWFGGVAVFALSILSGISLARSQDLRVDETIKAAPLSTSIDAAAAPNAKSAATSDLDSRVSDLEAQRAEIDRHSGSPAISLGVSGWVDYQVTATGR